MFKSWINSLRWIAIIFAVFLLSYSGHLWNKIKVIEGMVLWFDLIIFLMILAVVAMLFFDATETRKTIFSFLLLILGLCATIAMRCHPPAY